MKTLGLPTCYNNRKTAQKIAMNWHSLIFLSTVVLIFILLVITSGLANQSIFQERKINSGGELPKLYSGVQWILTKKEELGFLSRTGKQYYEEGYRFESMGLKSYPNDFIVYYENELASRGWKKINNVEGPGVKSYFYSKIHNRYQIIQHYIFGSPLKEKFISFGVLLPGWSKEYPNYYQAYVEHN